MLLRNRKRKRKPGLDSAQEQHKKSEVTGDFLVEHTISNTFPDIYPYLNRRDIANLAATNRFFNQLTQDEQMWYRRYKDDFGEIIYKEDIQAQYKAETCMRLLKEAWNINHYHALVSVLSLHNNKPWALHYNLFVESCKDLDEKYINNLVSIFSETNNIRIAELVLYLCAKQVNKRLLQNSSCLTNLKKLLLEIEHCKTKRLICFIDCLLFRMKSGVFLTRQRLLSHFLSLLDLTSTDISECIHDFNFVLKQLSGFFPVRFFDYRKEFLPGSTVLDVIVQMGKRAAVLKTIIFDWLKERADENNGLAQFYYGEYLYDQIIGRYSGRTIDRRMRELLATSRDYYVNAYNNDCYKAVGSRSDNRFGGLYNLLCIDDKLLDSNSYKCMLLNASLHGDVHAKILLAKRVMHGRWEKNIQDIWYIQEAILASSQYVDVQYEKKDLIKCIQAKIYPDCNKNLFLLMTIVHFSQSEIEASRKYYDVIHFSCPALIEKYVETGRKIGFQAGRCKDIFEVLAKRYSEDNSQSLDRNEHCSLGS